ncbi:MAG: NAD(P)/FAD-dependent oxidoreductase [Acidobacteriota bacterium]|nr:NAD(P)/FAD-dependent oxidoreductase [Acidobacteriota bacterium]
MERANVVIVGGGVVGCAIARALSARWSDVFVLEALPKIGMGTSTRNSGVIHSGIYYPPGSLKAKLCVRGNRLTYEFCAAHNVPHRNCGKLVVAALDEEIKDLTALMQNGCVNGVEGLAMIDREEIRAREPHVAARHALLVPSTGIVSAEDLVKAYARVAADRGAHIVTNAKVDRLEPLPDGVRIHSAAGEIEARCLVNSAGLFADEMASLLGSKMAEHRIYPVRGEYCELVRSRQDWVRGLVYPVPHHLRMTLGVHLVKTVWGNVLLGPTAHYVDDKNDYERNRERVEDFAEAAKQLLPELTVADLVPSYTGIRAKLAPPPGASGGTGSANAMTDFIIQRDPEFPQVVQLIGIESPGLTSAAAIAELAENLVREILD